MFIYFSDIGIAPMAFPLHLLDNMVVILVPQG